MPPPFSTASSAPSCTATRCGEQELREGGRCGGADRLPAMHCHEVRGGAADRRTRTSSAALRLHSLEPALPCPAVWRSRLHTFRPGSESGSELGSRVACHDGCGRLRPRRPCGAIPPSNCAETRISPPPPPPHTQRGVMHRDVKPDNFLFVGDPLKIGAMGVKLADFGLSCFYKKGEPQFDDVGSPLYVSGPWGKRALFSFFYAAFLPSLPPALATARASDRASDRERSSIHYHVIAAWQ